MGQYRRLTSVPRPKCHSESGLHMIRVRPTMALTKSFTAICLITLMGFSSALRAQTTKTLSLSEILDRTEANLNHYDADLPSLFCSEHVVSSRVQYGPPDQATVTDSIFRLKRTRRPNHTTDFVESRRIKTVDGRTATSQHIDGPAMLSGVFEGGFAVVSREQAGCMSYKLQSLDTSSQKAQYIVRFSTVPTLQKSADCFLQEESEGRAFIDPASMQITRLEIITPRHIIVQRSAFRSAITGKRKLTIDYAPVSLGGETFWMPSIITMRTTSGFGFRRIIWSFRATYRNYHRLEVTTRILPGSEVQSGEMSAGHSQ